MAGNSGGEFQLGSATPLEVVAEAVQRILAEDYSGAAALYHSDFVEGRVEDAWRAAQPRAYRPTVEDLLRQNPDMPQEAAEYEVRRAANAPPPPPSFAQVYGVESEPELAALEPREILARQLWASDHRWRFRAFLDELAGKHPQYQGQLAEQKERLTHLYRRRDEPLGWVENGDRAYVVLGASEESLHGRKQNVPDDGMADLVVLRREGAGWRISSSLGLEAGAIAVHLHVAVKDEDGSTVVLS